VSTSSKPLSHPSIIGVGYVPDLEPTTLDTAAAVGITDQAVDYGLTFGVSGLFAG